MTHSATEEFGIIELFFFINLEIKLIAFRELKKTFQCAGLNRSLRELLVSVRVSAEAGSCEVRLRQKKQTERIQTGCIQCTWRTK